MERRVVVTGLGVISSVGNDVKTFWDNLVGGVSGIDRIKSFPTDDLSACVAGEIKDFDPSLYGMERGFSRKQDLFTLYAEAAAFQALNQSGLVSGENIDPDRFGVYMGSGVGGFETQFNDSNKMTREGAKWVSPAFVPTMIANIAGANIAIRHKAQGPSLCVVAACATGTNAIGEAYRAIKHGYADALISGGAERCILPMTVATFANAKALSKVDDPARASLPFHAQRSGFVLSEGAGVLILEDYEHAVGRGAEILAELCGYGHTNDAYHVTAPNSEGHTQAKAISDALEQARYTSEDILYVNAHGTGTALNDVCETKALKMALGDDAYKAHISSTKSMTGHALGAAGAIEAVASVLALREGIVPPTIGLDEPDPECDLDYTPLKAVKADLTLAISESLGFGGHNACVAFRKINN